jgi:hypothetical protein
VKSSREELFESLTGLFVSIREVEPVRIDPDVATRQLDAVATAIAGQRLGRCE